MPTVVAPAAWGLRVTAGNDLGVCMYVCMHACMYVVHVRTCIYITITMYLLLIYGYICLYTESSTGDQSAC